MSEYQINSLMIDNNKNEYDYKPIIPNYITLTPY